MLRTETHPSAPDSKPNCHQNCHSEGVEWWMVRDSTTGPTDLTEEALRARIFEMPPDSGIFYIQYFDINGNRRREKAGRRSDAVTLLVKRKTEKLQGKKLPENLRRGAVPFKELLEDALEISQAENGTETTYNQDKERRYSARSSQ